MYHWLFITPQKERPISMCHTRKGQYLCTTPGKANIYMKRPISMYHTRKGQYLHEKANIYVPNQERPISTWKANSYVPNQERPISTCMYHSKRQISMYNTKKGQYLCTTPKKAIGNIYVPHLRTTERKANINIYVPQKERPVFIYHRKKSQYLCTTERKANVYVYEV